MNHQRRNPNSIRCKARVKTGKQCKKMSIPGYDFCRVHGFGRVKGSPWYENGIFLTVVSLVIGFFIAYVFFLKGPSQESQNEMLAKQCETLTNVHAVTNLPMQMGDVKNALVIAQKEQAMAGKIDASSSPHLGPIISCGGARFIVCDPNGTIFCDNGEPVVSLKRDGKGRLLLSTKIRNEMGELIAEIRENEWKLNPDLLFDRNYTNFAVEVRERSGNVVLQVADVGDVIHFEAIIRCKNGMPVTIGRDEIGPVLGIGTNNNLRIPEIFEYPSSLHMGSCPGYADLQKVEPPIESGKPFGYLFSKPLEIGNLPVESSRLIRF